LLTAAVSALAALRAKRRAAEFAHSICVRAEPAEAAIRDGPRT
jgi:hypothetical protein